MVNFLNNITDTSGIWYKCASIPFICAPLIKYDIFPSTNIRGVILPMALCNFNAKREREMIKLRLYNLYLSNIIRKELYSGEPLVHVRSEN